MMPDFSALPTFSAGTHPENEQGEATGVKLQLCALLLTDIVDSVRLVSEIGDQRSAQVFGEVDRVARAAMFRFGGVEADRTDGHLFRFARPIDAVSCALQYHENLHALSAELGIKIRLRAGIHLGEILVSHNTTEAVARGAKPYEIEGLALPIVARVMGLADGGQTLLTQAAFDLARRGAVGHESLPVDIEWLAHGSYLLKGVDEPLQIFEVGSAKRAPLRPPSDSPKARRAVSPGEDVTLGWRPATDQPVPGRRNFILVDKLGEGGFGEAWLARHAKTHEARVFKFCFQADRIRALKREVTLFRVLKETLGDRDDIARVLDWQFEESPYYLELEYTGGGSLVEWAEKQGGIAAVPIERRLEIVAQVAVALAAAHSVGVLHKDVKPSNILISATAGGEIRSRLTDFGIGFITDREHLAEKGITATGLTEVGVTSTPDSSRTGTRLYMAPELLEGKHASIQSDVFALGVLLYQCVAGDLHRALGVGWERDIPDELLREDITSCIERSPERRLGDALRLAEGLRALPRRTLELRETRERQHAAENYRLQLETSRKRRRVLGVVSFMLVILVLAIGYVARQEREAYNRERALKMESEDAKVLALQQQAKAEKDAERANAEQIRANMYVYRARVQLAQFAMLAGDQPSEELRRTLLSTYWAARGWEHKFLSYWAEYPDWETTETVLAASPDERHFVLQTADKALRLGAYEKGAEAELLWNAGEKVFGCEFANSADTLVAYTTSTVTLFDIVKRERLWTCDFRALQERVKRGAMVRRCAIANSAEFVLTALNDGTVAILSGADGKPRKWWLGRSPGGHAAISPDNRLVAICTAGVPVEIRDVKTGELRIQLKPENPVGRITADFCAFSPDGKRVIAGLSNTKAAVWDVESGKLVRTLAGHAAPVTVAKFSTDGSRIITGSSDNVAVVWSAETGERLRQFETNNSITQADLLSSTGRVMVSSSLSSRLWHYSPPTTCTMAQVYAGRVRRVRFAHRSYDSALSCADGKVRIWDVNGLREKMVLDTHTTGVMDAQFSSDDQTVICGCTDGSVRRYELSTSTPKELVVGYHTRDVNALAFSPDGKYFASAGSDVTCKLWSLSDNSLVHEYQAGSPTNAYGFRTVWFSGATSQVMLVRWAPPTVTAWDYQSGRSVTSNVAIPTLTGAAIHEGAKAIVCAGLDGQVTVNPLKLDFNSTSTFQLYYPPVKVGNGYVQDVQFTPEGERFITVGQDGWIGWWDANDRDRIVRLPVPGGKKLWSAAFSNDSGLLAAGSDDGTLVVWRTFRAPAQE